MDIERLDRDGIANLVRKVRFLLIIRAGAAL
jgi:hypothetical protein